MTQLILDVGGDEVVLPEAVKGGYTAEPSPLYADVKMISGRMTREFRGDVWQVSYQYGFFSDEEKKKLLAACQKGRRKPIQCGFLPPDSTGALSYGEFLVMDVAYPKFMWSRVSGNDSGEGTCVPLWANFSVTLREVSPHD